MNTLYQNGQSVAARSPAPRLEANQPGDDAGVPTGAGQIDTATWQAIVARYQQPSRWRSIWQLVNTLGPYALLWYLMDRSLAVSYWLTLPLAILAGGFLVAIGDVPGK